MEKHKISQQKLDELKTELKKAIADRKDIIERVSTARELGDLKENAEYHSARDEQRANESRIEEIEGILDNYEIADGGSKDSIDIGNKVVLKAGSDTKEFTIVTSVEANPLEGKISDQSPVGKSMIGKKVGDEVELAGKKYKIGEIN